jgi:hypothetical protein
LTKKDVEQFDQVGNVILSGDGDGNQSVLLKNESFAKTSFLWLATFTGTTEFDRCPNLLVQDWARMLFQKTSVPCL